MKRLFAIITAAMVLCTMADAKGKKEVTYNENGEIIKTGVNLGPLPVVAFDADRGFQFGALLNLYNFGDGKNYPNPNSQWYIEASAYVKNSTVGSYKFILNYDNKTLIPGVRMSVCAGYYKDAALDFYGFNGFQSNYDMGLVGKNITFNAEVAAVASGYKSCVSVFQFQTAAAAVSHQLHAFFIDRCKFFKRHTEVFSRCQIFGVDQCVIFYK